MQESRSVTTETPAIWVPAVTSVSASLTSQPVILGVDRPDALSDALSDAEAALADALAQPPSDPGALAAELLDQASRLLAAASDLCSVGDRGVDGRRQSAAALAHELEFLENAILEGELTYALDASAMSRPLDRASEALTHPWGSGRVGVGVRVSLRTASAELGALLVRAVANLETTGDARHANAAGPATLAAAVDALVRQTAEHADAFPQRRPADRQDDTVGRHLCESLRFPVELSALDALDHAAADEASRRDALESARRAWLALAAREYAVASRLDAELPSPGYKLRFGSVANAIAAGAINVLCGGRLLPRADAFRHRRAWGRQGVALSHAIEAYINGLRGDREALVRAQLIVISRLIRSVAALALLDSQRHRQTSGANGRSR
jgi:hypothetical protein